MHWSILDDIFTFASAEELGIKELIPAYLDPNLQDNDLPTGVSFASGATGFDPQTPVIVVKKIYAPIFFVYLT